MGKFAQYIDPKSVTGTAAVSDSYVAAGAKAASRRDVLQYALGRDGR